MSLGANRLLDAESLSEHLLALELARAVRKPEQVGRLLLLRSLGVLDLGGKLGCLVPFGAVLAPKSDPKRYSRWASDVNIFWAGGSGSKK